MVGNISSGKTGGLQYLDDGKDKFRLLENGEVITREMMDNRIVLAGDIESTKAILKEVEKKNYTKDYYHLSFSFKENIDSETMQEILKEVEEFYLSGYDKSEYNIYAEAHISKDESAYKLEISSDGFTKKYRFLSEEQAKEYNEKNPDAEKKPEKRHDHFHVIIPKINLVTNTQLKITEKDEVRNIDAFHEYINIKYELESAKESKRDISDKQFKDEKYNPEIELEAKHFSDLTNAKTKKTLIEMVEVQIQNEKITSYDEMKSYLEKLDFIENLKEVSTSKNEYIKIKVVGQEKNVNLRNAVFSKEFYHDKEKDFSKETRRIEGKSLDDYKKIIDEYKTRRVKEVSKRYDFSREKAIKENLIEKALEEKFEDKTISNTSTKKILQDLNKNKSVFLTGGAGTGKSYTAKEVIAHYENEGKEVVKLGSTGLAAINVGGQTLHSFFNINISPDVQTLIKEEKTLEGDNKKLVKHKERMNALRMKLGQTELIVIDEVSMISANQMEMIQYRLDNADYKGKLMFVGDFFQLPPVIKTDDKSFDKVIQIPQGAYAFESKTWENLKTITHELTEIKRSDNKDFAELLGRMRYGNLNDKDIVMMEQMQENVIDEDKATYIYTTNKDVNAHNEKQLQRIDGSSKKYKSSYKSDDTLTKEEVNALYKETPFEPLLLIKDDARVLISINNEEKGYANGDKGIFVGKHENGNLLVKLDRNDKVVEVEERTFKTEIDTKERGAKSFTVTGYPLRLGYAITTHKSQGMSIDNLSISPDFQFSYNQFYVALSRAKDPKTTNIHAFSKEDREVKKHKYSFKNILAVDARVVDFYHPTLRSKEDKAFEKEVGTRQRDKRKKWKETQIKKRKTHEKEKADNAKRAAKKRIKSSAPVRNRRLDRYKKVVVKQLDKFRKDLYKGTKKLSRFASRQLKKIEVKELLQKTKKVQQDMNKQKMTERLKEAQKEINKDNSKSK